MVWFIEGNWLTLWVLIAIAVTVYIIDRKKIRQEAPGLFLRRTGRGLAAVERAAKKRPRFWRAFGYVGFVLSVGAVGLLYILLEQRRRWPKTKTAIFAAIVFAFITRLSEPLTGAITAALGAMGYIVTYLIGLSGGILVGAIKEPTLQIIAPFQVEGAPIFFVPLQYFFIALTALIVVHELSHAIVARTHGIRVRSLGYGFFGFIPLAFAELDTKQMKREAGIKKVGPIAAGSFANILLALASIAVVTLALFAISAAFVGSGVEYTATIAGMPAASFLPKHGVVTEVNGLRIEHLQNLSDVLKKIRTNQSVNIVVSGARYNLTAAAAPENASRAFIGISQLSTKLEVRPATASIFGGQAPWSLFYILQMFRWLFILNLGVGLANLLPIKPLDGGFLIEELLKKAAPRAFRTYYKLIAIITLAVIVINIIGPYLIRAIVVNV